MISLNSYLKKIASKIASYESEIKYWSSKLKKDYNLISDPDQGVTGYPIILRQIYNILSPVPKDLIKDCGIHNLLLRSDMGPSKPYYPNHGYFVGNLVALNEDIFHNPDLPDDFFNHRGYFLTRPQQTLLHEFAHGYDAFHSDLSLQPKWLKLSGWSETPQKGLKRLVINDPGVPQVIGEWYYDPKITDKPESGFTRFYAKRNPYDDFADSFAFYIANMKDKLPQNKKLYFDNLLKKYY